MSNEDNKPIVVGDLVYIWRTCCKQSADAFHGRIFKVTLITRTRRLHCTLCGHVEFNEQLVEDGNTPNGIESFAAPRSECKRIPPLGELETLKDLVLQPIQITIKETNHV